MPAVSAISVEGIYHIVVNNWQIIMIYLIHLVSLIYSNYVFLSGDLENCEKRLLALTCMSVLLFLGANRILLDECL
jgi:hypothetical protein